MMLVRQLLGFSLLFTFCLSIPFNTRGEKTPTDSKSNLIHRVASRYLTSFSGEPRILLEHEEEEARKSKIKHYSVRPKIDQVTEREVAFYSLWDNSAFSYDTSSLSNPILNEYAFDDLKLYCGTTKYPKYHLLDRINKTTAVVGESVLALMLGNPTTSIPTLQHRKDIIKMLGSHPKELAQLQSAIHNFSEAEKSVLSFWTDHDPLYSEEYTNYMNRKFYSKNHPKRNKSVGKLEFKKRFFRDFIWI